MKRAWAFSLTLHLAAAVAMSLWLSSWFTAPDPKTVTLSDVDLLSVGHPTKAAARPVKAAPIQAPVPATVPAPGASVDPQPSDQVSIEVDGTRRGLSPAEYMAWVRSHNQGPAYPRLANLRRQEGRAVVRAIVKQSGALELVELEQSSGSELLDQAALEAVRGWRFPEFTGRDSQLMMKIPFKFLLDEH